MHVIYGRFIVVPYVQNAFYLILKKNRDF